MPITPLHFGLLPVIHRVIPAKVSTAAFVLANIVIDIPVVMHLYMDQVHEMGGPAVAGSLHSESPHTFLGALVLGILLALIHPRTRAWWLGSILGTLSHVALDMFVHADVAPFAPLTQWNPFYFESAHAILSVVLTVGLAWFVVECWDRRRAGRQTSGTSPQEHPDVP